MTNPSPLLCVEDLAVRYGRVIALRGVSITVGRGELIGVIGPNGAGKSTLLGTIAGAVRAASGGVKFEGNDLLRMPPEAIARLGIALVPERRRIFSRLSVEENLRLGATARRSVGGWRDGIDEVAEVFPLLKAKLGVTASSLSGGEQQQLALGRALIARPKLLLVDEPSLGLAPKIVDEVFAVLLRLRESGITVLLVEQNAVRTAATADDTYLLVSGVSRRLQKHERVVDELARSYLGASNLQTDREV